MLEVRQVEVSYGEFLALRGISFTVQEGELVTIIGANGAGKSTILRAVMGLVKCRQGEIFFQGEDITLSPPIAGPAWESALFLKAEEFSRT